MSQIGERWAIDFMPDSTTDGDRFRILTLIDTSLVLPVGGAEEARVMIFEKRRPISKPRRWSLVR